MDALEYLRHSPDTFWEWPAYAEVVTWRDGPTIAFRRELAAILEPHAAVGLPPFDLVLFVLAACRDDWPEDWTETLLLRSLLPEGKHDWVEACVNDLGMGTARVRKLPPSLRSTLAGKRALVAAVFEFFPYKTSAETAQSVLDLLRSNVVPEMMWMPLQRPQPLRVFVQRVRVQALCQGIRSVTAESLELRMRTGLDRRLAEPPPPDAEDESPPAAVPSTVRELLDALEQDREFAGLAKLTRNLMAVVHLPQSLDERDELPMGGVSDVTNRGPFDRLLLSELAHDADTLVSRVALGEALYLRRERPPSLPPRRRVVLLDCGIRMWGVPRVFAAAVALSVAARADRGGEAAVFRASGKNVEPVDHRTRDGLETHLAALEPHAHPGAALPALAAEVGAEPTDVVLVTCADALADPEFRQALDATELRECVIACVGRDGLLRLTLRTVRGEKLLREARLDLDAILEPPPQPQPPLVDKSRDPNLPAIFGVRPFPLRLAHHVNREATWAVGWRGVLSITPDRRLMHWDEKGLGARQLTDRLPSHRLLWWKLAGNGAQVDAVVGQFGRNPLHLLSVDLDTGRATTYPLDTGGNKTRAVFEYGGLLVVVCGDSACVFSMLDGKRLSTALLPRHLHWRGRFFSGNDGWYALALRGHSIETELVLPWKATTPSFAEAVFDSEPAGGPVAVLANGRVLFLDGSTEGGRLVGVMPPLKLMDVAPDGSSFVGRWKSPRSGAQEFHLCTLPDLHVTPIGTPKVPPGQEAIWGLVRHTDIRSSFRQIGVLFGSLVVVTRKGRKLRLFCDREADRLQLVDLPFAEVKTHLPQPFRSVKAPDGVGYRLRVAEWADGSRAFVDSRGLLHLKSSDPTIPEATLVLDDRHVSGWSADGRLWGSQFHVAHHVVTPAAEIDATILEPFIRRLR